MSKKKPVAATKSLALRPKTFLDYYTDIDKRDREGKPTCGNATRSYAQAYNRAPDQTAQTEGSNLLRKPLVHSELEQIVLSLGEGVKVRLRGILDIAGGRTTRKVTSRHYTYHKDENGKTRKKAAGETVTTVETRDSDRLKAAALLNKMTGLDALTSAAADIAIKESRDLYNRMVRPGRRESTPKSADSIRQESTQEG